MKVTHLRNGGDEVEKRLLSKDLQYEDWLQRTESRIRIVTVDQRGEEVGEIEIKYDRSTTREDSDIIAGFYAQGKTATQRILSNIVGQIEEISRSIIIRGIE
jgi:hypothetical protein